MIDLSLLQDFITEANEHLEEMESGLLKLEREPDDLEILNDIFRAIHTIKGASQFVGLPRVSELSHKMENLLDLLRQGEKKVNQDIIDTLIETRDRLINLTKELEINQAEKSEIDDLLARILSLSDEAPPALDCPEEPPAEAPSDELDLRSALEEALDTSILDDVIAGGSAASIQDDDLDTSILGDFFGEDSPPNRPDQEELFASSSEPLYEELIRNELRGEEHDEELFDIFIGQTRNNLDKLRQLTAQLHDPANGAESFASCRDLLANLRSSANYMSYANLVGLYDLWQAELSAAGERLAESAETDFSFMDDHLALIFRTIPRLNESQPAAADPFAENQGGEDLAVPSVAGVCATDEETIRAEISEELYDDELFEIFLKQVSENLGSIRRAMAEGGTGDRTNLLELCRDRVAKLKSSANYMGYANLVDLYERWHAQISEAGMDDDPGFINDYLDLMSALFPDLPDSGPEEEPRLFADNTDGPRAEPSSGGEDRSNEDDLFATLSDSIDTAMAGGNRQGMEPLHGILEEMLFGEASSVNEEAPIETPSAPELDEEPGGTESGEEPVEATGEVATPDLGGEERRRTERRREERREGGERTYKQSIRVDSDKIDSLMNQVGELVVSRAYFAQIFNYLKEFQQEMKEEGGFDAKGLKPIRELTFKLGEATVGLGRVSNELQEGVMKIRMLPVAQLFNRYPRLVRDLIHKTGKKVNLEVRGEETELDKMVIEEISDPLIHIIRNAVDHGLETPEERRKAGKDETGSLVLEAYHESNHIVIEITDDGRGIDIDKIKSKAVAKGLISQQEISRISDAEARRFIMMPGFSTAETATETSGRGVGMDVIKTNIEKLNGTVEVESQQGVQTMIRIKIPLTLAIIQALMVRVGDELFTIPLSVVEETLRIFEHDTSTIEGVEVIHMRDTTMPIFRLADVFGIEGASRDISQSFVVIVTTGMQEIGLVVDELIGQEEVVIKPLVDYLREESGFSGATIIGDGRISLILDIYELVKMTSEKQIERSRAQTMSRKNKNRVIKAGGGMKKVPSAEAAGPETIH
ncbi:MAG: chemotaxis protein CheA [Desulfurivibrionaceae bacterium]